MTPVSLKYADSTDRAFGLCGMALALYIFDAEKYLDSISLEAPADCGLTLTSDFFTPANPCLSVKSVWSSSLQHFQLTSGMVIGNLLARSIARRRTDLPANVRSLMMTHLVGEGEEACGLEPAEVNRLCDKAYDYLHQLLLHPAVNSAVCAMARELSERSVLSRDQIMPYLLPLSNL